MKLPYLWKQLRFKVLILLKLTWESVLPGGWWEFNFDFPETDETVSFSQGLMGIEVFTSQGLMGVVVFTSQMLTVELVHTVSVIAQE